MITDGSYTMRFVLSITFLSLLSTTYPVHGSTQRSMCGVPHIPGLTPAEKASRISAWQRDPTATHTIGDQEQLWIYSYETRTSELVNFTYRGINSHSAILVADLWWSATNPHLVNPNDVTRFSHVFEQNSGPGAGVGKGIYELLTQSYAPVTPVCLQTKEGVVCDDGMVYIALCEIKSALEQGYVVGYVAQRDRLVGAPRSNERNMIVIDVSQTPQALAE